MTTREQHWQQKRRYAHVHAILSNPPRKPLWRRVWDLFVETTP